MTSTDGFPDSLTLMFTHRHRLFLMISFATVRSSSNAVPSLGLETSALQDGSCEMLTFYSILVITYVKQWFFGHSSNNSILMNDSSRKQNFG